MSYRAGELDKRVVVEERQTAADGVGGQVVTWSPRGTVWGHLRPLSGRERAAAGTLQAQGRYRLVIRRGAVAITESDRVLWGGDYYDVVHVGDARARDNFVEIELEKGGAQ